MLPHFVTMCIAFRFQKENTLPYMVTKLQLQLQTQHRHDARQGSHPAVGAPFNSLFFRSCAIRQRGGSRRGKRFQKVTGYWLLIAFDLSNFENKHVEKQ